MRVGVLGGTFDPVHLGHLAIAEEVRIKLDLDRVIFIPAGQPRLRADEYLTPAIDRLRMVELATGDNPQFQVCDIEIQRSGPTFTVDTLVELGQRLDPDTSLYFIVGADILGQLHRSSADLFNSRHQRCRHFSYLDNIGALCTGAGRNSRRPLGALVNPASDGRNLGFLEGAILRRHDVIVISTERDPFHQEAGGGFSRLNRLAVLASLERIGLRVKLQLGLRFFLSVTLEAIRLQDRQHLFGKVDILGQYSRAGRCEKAEKNGWEKATASRFKLELRYRVHQMKFPHVRVLRDGCSR